MKRAKKQNVHQPEKQWLQIMTALVFLVFLLVGGLTLWTIVQNNRQAEQAQINAENNQRKQRIEAVYDSFNLDDSYKVNKVDIFGDKRSYAWDNARTYASAVEYTRFTKANDTLKDVTKRVKRAGFRVVEKPVPTAMNAQYTFKNDQNVFVRLTVVSREVHDALMANQSPKDADKNASPSIVMINVNLDNNTQ